MDTTAAVATIAGMVVSILTLSGIMVFIGLKIGKSVGEASQVERPRKPRKVKRKAPKQIEMKEEDADNEPMMHSVSLAVKPRKGSKGRASVFDMLPDEDVIGAGFSMAEALSMAEAGQAAAMARSPVEVLAELQQGNVRFWTGQSTRPERSAFQRRALISKQFPSTAIFSCADSRVPPEILFDVGLGDMFVVRVAGNCLDLASAASLQYAVRHLKVKLLIVMGHEGCGAIKAAQLPFEAIMQEPTSLSTLLNRLSQGLEQADMATLQDSKAADRQAVTTNVRNQVDRLCYDDGIMSKVRSGDLMMVGAMYEISSGIVDFFHEVSGMEDPGASRGPSPGVKSRCPDKGTVSTTNVTSFVPVKPQGGKSTVSYADDIHLEPV